MKHQAQCYVDEAIEAKEVGARIIEFLKEYWGFDEIQLRYLESDQVDLTFFAFWNLDDYRALQATNFCKTPYRKEVFRFDIKDTCLTISYFNGFDNNEREKQFERIVSLIEKAIREPVPPFRIRTISPYLADVMYRYRRKDGKIGFLFSPTSYGSKYGKVCGNSIFIYWDDFEYLRKTIIEGFDLTDTDKEGFDNTSCNQIQKAGCEFIINHLRNYKTENPNLLAFVNYVASWIEDSLSKDDAYGILIDGNL